MHRLALAFLLLFPFLLLPASADDLHDRFDKAVKQLRSDDAAERDKGSAELEAIAKEAPELVLPLAKDADPEVKGRAVAVLKPLDDAEAETLFRKVEEKYSGAKTVQYRVAMDVTGTGIKESMKIAAKSGNMFRYEITKSVDSAAEGSWTVYCDGKALREPVDGELDRPMGVSPNAADLLRGGMVRVGIWEDMRFLQDRRLPSMSEKFPVDDLEAEADESVDGHEAKVLSYSVKQAGKDRSGRQKLWIDAEKNVVLKRELTSSDGFTVTETYSDTKFDEEIPDEKFALPKETKEK